METQAENGVNVVKGFSLKTVVSLSYGITKV